MLCFTEMGIVGAAVDEGPLPYSRYGGVLGGDLRKRFYFKHISELKYTKFPP